MAGDANAQDVRLAKEVSQQRRAYAHVSTSNTERCACLQGPSVLRTLFRSIRGYRGQITPAAALDCVCNEGNTVIVDIRTDRCTRWAQPACTVLPRQLVSHCVSCAVCVQSCSQGGFCLWGPYLDPGLLALPPQSCLLALSHH